MKKSEILYYVQKRKEGWDNSQIRRDLKSQGYDKQDVFYYLNEIDDTYVKSINEKSDFTINNVSLRILELIIGIPILITGLVFIALCVVYGPGLLAIMIGSIGSSFGYYFTQRGYKGIKDIKNATHEKMKANQELKEDTLD